MERESLVRHGLFAGVIVAALGTIVVASAFTDGRGGRAVHLSGERVTEERAHTDFNGVRLLGGYEVDLEAGADFSVEITADRAILELTETSVENGTLVVAPKGNRKLGNTGGIALRIRMPALAHFTVDGAADADLKKIDSDSLALTINGAGEIDLAGRCGTLAAVTNGAGEISGHDLRCHRVTVTLNGAGKASVHADEEVTVAINGVGNVEVYGNPPRVTKSDSGLGKVVLRGEAEE